MSGAGNKGNLLPSSSCAVELPACCSWCILRDAHIMQVEYSDTQLDFLALLFTVVKLLYIGGALSRCAPVVQLLDAATKASAHALHKTLVRNEAAYFGCVKQLILDFPPPPQPQSPQPKPLYLCGDSHCLSGILAWLGSIPLCLSGCKISEQGRTIHTRTGQDRRPF